MSAAGSSSSSSSSSSTQGILPVQLEPSEERPYTAELMALSEFAASGSSLLGQVSGVIKSDQARGLERVLFRATRGNAVFETEVRRSPAAAPSRPFSLSSLPVPSAAEHRADHSPLSASLPVPALR